MASEGEKAFCGEVRGHSHYQHPPGGSDLLFPLKEGPHYVAQAGLEHTALLQLPTGWGYRWVCATSPGFVLRPLKGEMLQLRATCVGNMGLMVARREDKPKDVFPAGQTSSPRCYGVNLNILLQPASSHG